MAFLLVKGQTSLHCSQVLTQLVMSKVDRPSHCEGSSLVQENILFVTSVIACASKRTVDSGAQAPGWSVQQQRQLHNERLVSRTCQRLKFLFAALLLDGRALSLVKSCGSQHTSSSDPHPRVCWSHALRCSRLSLHNHAPKALLPHHWVGRVEVGDRLVSRFASCSLCAVWRRFASSHVPSCWAGVGTAFLANQIVARSSRWAGVLGTFLLVVGSGLLLLPFLLDANSCPPLLSSVSPDLFVGGLVCLSGAGSPLSGARGGAVLDARGWHFEGVAFLQAASVSSFSRTLP